MASVLSTSAFRFDGVDDTRTIVIYQSAVLMVTATDGQASAARAFDVALWEPPVDYSDRNSVDLLTAFIDEVVAITDAARR